MSKRTNLIKSENPLAGIHLGSTNSQSDELTKGNFVGEIYAHPYSQKDLYKLVEYSTVLGQCIEAYKRNIPGFGISFKYNIEDDVETPEMITEWNQIDDVVDLFNMEMSFSDLLGEIIEDREKCGNGYMEVLRDGKGLPAEGVRVNPMTMYVAKSKSVSYSNYYRKGRKFQRQRKFKRYAQKVGTSYVWFKEFGDPRFMDSTTGDYTNEHNGEKEATEILHFKIGKEVYGIPRYIGQLIHMYGARKAEELNYNYFYQGRHIPAAIIVSNGILTDESYESLTNYAKNIEGTNNAHKFMILEAEGYENSLDEDGNPKNVKIEMKSLSEMLQKDALFLDYDENSRNKVQSAFRLPDIYVGRTRDFNRATSETAREVTEEQVFIPERNSLEFLINNVLLTDYEFAYVKAKLNRPEISNTQDKATLLKTIAEIGGITPNDVRDEAAKVLGKPLENLEGDIYDSPKWINTNNQGTRIIQEPLLPIIKSDTNLLREVRDMLEDQYNGNSNS